MITLSRICVLLFVFSSLLSSTLPAQNTDFQAGATPYTPQQLHELLVGQSKEGVLQFFGRMPNHIQGFDWIYERLLIYVAEQDQYYTTAVVCFSHGDHLVWQVVSYPN
ncbi:MAG: hypothetical protein NTZ01_06455 [Verrucomicrobia bacterium]|nr:hypothetical protein [Verrucomicrobiota bacterium]